MFGRNHVPKTDWEEVKYCTQHLLPLSNLGTRNCLNPFPHSRCQMFIMFESKLWWNSRWVGNDFPTRPFSITSVHGLSFLIVARNNKDRISRPLKISTIPVDAFVSEARWVRCIIASMLCLAEKAQLGSEDSAPTSNPFPRLNGWSQKISQRMFHGPWRVVH